MEQLFVVIDCRRLCLEARMQILRIMTKWQSKVDQMTKRQSAFDERRAVKCLIREQRRKSGAGMSGTII